MPRKDLERIKAAQREDLETGLVDPDAHAGELTAGMRWRLAAAWLSRGLDRWTHRFERIGNWLKAIATALGSLAAIVALWRALRTRNVAPAELPKGTGAASTFADRVEKPIPPRP